MAKIIEVTLQCKIHDDGDRTYLVVSRHGNLGESAPNQILFDGHFGGDALKELRTAMAAAMAEDLPSLTMASDTRKEFNNIPLGYSFTPIKRSPDALEGESREEFERDRMGQTGADNAKKMFGK